MPFEWEDGTPLSDLKGKNFNNLLFKDPVFNDKKVILILCDDFSYSGNQLSGHLSASQGNSIKEWFQQDNIQIGFDESIKKNIKYYLNIIGLTNEAEEKIRNELYEPQLNLILPTARRTYNSRIGDIIKRIDKQTINSNNFYVIIKDNEKLIVVPQFNAIFKDEIKNNLTVVYQSIKYPDAQSTSNILCRIAGSDNKKYINYDIFNSFYPDALKDGEPFELNSIINDKPILLKKIIDNWDNWDNLSDISWLGKCKKIEKHYIKYFEKDSWIKLFDTCDYDDSKKINCMRICSNRAFYKKINYKYNGNNINNIKSLKEIFEDSKPKKSINNEKYLKYKKKYLLLKKEFLKHHKF
jgi:hypothetical protein